MTRLDPPELPGELPGGLPRPPAARAAARRVVIFADVNPNLIDGSTIWLQSLARAFAGIPGAEVTVVLRDPLTTDIVLGPVRAAGARMVALRELAPERAGRPEQLLAAFEALDGGAGVDLFVVRGRSFIEACARSPRLAPRLCAYWLDRPDIVHPAADPLAEVAPAVGRIVVQSSLAAALMETVFRVPAERILVLPPMVPEEAFAEAPTAIPAADAPARLVYSGKIDRTYNVEAYLGLPALLAERGIPATVTVVGDKFNAAPEDPGFVARMKAALTAIPGVTWERGVARSRALALMATGDFGLCWRTARYDNSLEVSTKLLEFAALGVPPLLNRTAIHERLLGADYPFFVRDPADMAAAIARGRAEPALMAEARARLRATARAFSLAAVRDRLAGALATLPRRPQAPAQVGRAALRVVIASHDSKFLRRVIEALRRDERFEIREDNWLGLRKNDPAQSKACLRWADLVFCEWCAGAAVWYSNRLRPGQSCIVRLHRVELFEDDPRKVDFARVDRLIVVSDWFRAESVRRFGVDPHRIDVLPQYVDWAQLNRPKHPWAKTLGMVGINGFDHKRPDRALDVLERLLARDPDWRLRIRTAMPWEISWIWRRDQERAAFQGLFRRIVDTPALRDAIVFDPAGPDMAEWYRHIGYILSPSDTEGCHTAVAEAMASGAPPIINAWPGAASVYPAEFVCDGAEAMAEKLLALQAEVEAGGGEGLRARIADLARPFDLGRTVEHFTRLFLACGQGQKLREQKMGRDLRADTG